MFSLNFHRIFLLIFLFVTMMHFFPFAFAVMPFGANITMINNSVSAPDLPTSVNAQAGNVTEMNVFGYSVTQSWQGYYGNVSGAIQLSDGNDNVFYNWSLASPEGEIYASTSNSINWGNIQCFNWTENGTWLENSFNINSNDVDGVNETFSYSNGHDLFYTNNKQFSSNQCMSSNIFDGSGQSVTGNFEEVLLWDGTDVVFTSLLEADLTGFDSASHDFEMLVLEDGHSTDTLTTPYYFYVELQ